MPAYYFLGPRLLAATPALPLWSDTEVCRHSQLFVCPQCGEAWGRIAIDGGEWLPVRRGCPRHPWIEDVGGTFLAPWQTRLDALPKEVLLHELTIRLAAAEKELS